MKVGTWLNYRQHPARESLLGSKINQLLNKLPTFYGI